MKRKKTRAGSGNKKKSDKIPVHNKTFKGKTYHPNKKSSYPKWKRRTESIEQERSISPGLLRSLELSWEKTDSEIKSLLEESSLLSQTKKKDSSPFELDLWQEEAVYALTEGENVVIDAPTTAGKTRIVEAFFEANLHRPDFRACYTCPVKSLSNDKLREFRELFGSEYVGIATGDIKENLDAPIVVATLETYRNSLLGVEPDLGRHLVIFDEYHFIQDESRGSAWEEAMILTPPSCQILLLSASVANPEDFVGWLEKLSRRSSRLVTVKKRPVPLVNLVWFKNHWYLPKTLPKKAFDNNSNFRRPGHLPVDNLCERIVNLDVWKLTPCIVYAGKRASVIERALTLRHYLNPLEVEEKEKVSEALLRCDELFDSLRFMDKRLKDLILKYGVAYHHSGLTPPVRHTIEFLVKAGTLRFCFATMGLSLGINFSVRSTLVSDSSRPGEGGVTQYGPSEILQMTGRAGRRGRDLVGFSLWPTLSYYQKFGKTKRENGFSNLRKDATTFLGLVSRGYSIGQIEKVYAKSFLKYQAPKVQVGLLSADKLQRKLSKKVPCTSPVFEFARYRTKKDALCTRCPLKKNCHRLIRELSHGDLGRLHLHLHSLGALDEKDHLSPYGEIARHFPQNGGLLIAKWIHEGLINAENLLKTSQILAALSLGHYKKPGSSPSYQFPHQAPAVLKELSDLYPYDLFPEYYDPPFQRRQHEIFRDFNSSAGFLIKEWAMGYEWSEVIPQVVNEQFSDGDFTAVIYRVSSYLQSFTSLEETFPELARNAMELRGLLLREPVSF